MRQKKSVDELLALGREPDFWLQSETKWGARGRHDDLRRETEIGLPRYSSADEFLCCIRHQGIDLVVRAPRFIEEQVGQ